LDRSTASIAVTKSQRQGIARSASNPRDRMFVTWCEQNSSDVRRNVETSVGIREITVMSSGKCHIGRDRQSLI
jgi:hypothetical protein